MVKDAWMFLKVAIWATVLSQMLLLLLESARGRNDGTIATMLILSVLSLGLLIREYKEWKTHQSLKEAHDAKP